jgi:hypothetical protein
MEKQVAASLLLSGKCVENIWPRRGGRRWGILSDTGLPFLQDVDALFLAGCALGEFRMRVGFIDFPLGSSGGLHGAQIHAIGRSAAMKPWSVDGYNKPIPRRIAEEAGVPRHLFGQLKKGGGSRPVPVRQSLVGRVRIRLGEWKPWRVLGLRLFGNRFHPGWHDGSFSVQRCMDRAIERYQATLSNAAPSERRDVVSL